jgi:hypothetical protein
MPTVWEFYVAHEHEFARFYPEQDAVTLRRIESTFGVTVDNLTMESGWYHQVMTETQPVEVYEVEGLLGPITPRADPKQATPDDGVGARLWTIVDVARRTAATFTITWNRPGNTPGIEIRRNGATVYKDAANGGAGFFP